MPTMRGLGLMEILQVSARHRNTDKRGARFTQVRGPRRGNTRTSCLSDLYYSMDLVTMGLPMEQRRWDLAEGKVARVWYCVRVERVLGFLSRPFYRRSGPEDYIESVTN